MIISDNKTGNPYHADDGKFTSPDAATLGLSVDEFNQFKANGNSLTAPVSLRDDIDINELLKQELELVDGDINDIIKGFLQEEQDSFADLTFTRDIEGIKENAIKVLGNKKYLDNVYNELDLTSAYISNHISHTYYPASSRVNAQSNPIIMNLMYARYPKKATVISKQDYDDKIATIKSQGSGQLNPGYDWTLRGRRSTGMYDNIDIPGKRDFGCGLIAAYRGFSVAYATSTDMKNLKLMYSDQHHINPIVGESSNNHGSIHYFSMQHSYAHEWYANYNESNLVKGIVNLQNKPDVRIITTEQLRNMWYKMTNQLASDSKFMNDMKQAILGAVGDQKKADELYNCFYQTLTHDQGLVGLLSGAQAVVGAPTNGSQFDLYDLSLLEMVDE